MANNKNSQIIVSQKQNNSYIKLLINLWSHLSKRRRCQIILLAFLVPVGGMAEVMSLGAVLPLLAALISPENILEYKSIKLIALLFGIYTPITLIHFLFILFGTLSILSALFRLGLLWLITKVAFACGNDLSLKVLRITLYQDYSINIRKQTSAVIADITGKVASAGSIIQQILLLSNAAVMIALIIISITIVNSYIGIIVIFGFGIIYYIISLISKSRLEMNSLTISIQTEKLIRSLQDAMGSLRDIKIDGTQPEFLRVYRAADGALRKAQCDNNIISASPKFILESLAIILLLTITISYSNQTRGLVEVLPFLGMLIFATQKLLPSLQQIYASWASLAGMEASLSQALRLLGQKMPMVIERNSLEPLEFNKDIELKSICFKYEANGPLILNNISIVIPKGAKIGIIGVSGCGKSTLLDIIMGLISSTSGLLLVDGKIITQDVFQRWQKLIAHVPQNIFITNASLAENIAFGVPSNTIDMVRVRYAASQAHLASYIESLDQSYDTLAGERGVNLSGGQKQRLGIARALYKNAKILILDEATSALDHENELYVMRAIESLGKHITVITVSHSMAALEKHDFFYAMSQGELKYFENFRSLRNR